MERIYLYMHHGEMDFFLKDRMLSDAERYCTDCDAYDRLVGCYEDKDDLAEQIRLLLNEGLGLLPDGSFDWEEFISSLRNWKPEDFNEKARGYAMGLLCP